MQGGLNLRRDTAGTAKSREAAISTHQRAQIVNKIQTLRSCATDAEAGSLWPAFPQRPAFSALLDFVAFFLTRASCGSCAFSFLRNRLYRTYSRPRAVAVHTARKSLRSGEREMSPLQGDSTSHTSDHASAASGATGARVCTHHDSA